MEPNATAPRSLEKYTQQYEKVGSDVWADFVLAQTVDSYSDSFVHVVILNYYYYMHMNIWKRSTCCEHYVILWL